jgi:hypothetical protein
MTPTTPTLRYGSRGNVLGPVLYFFIVWTLAWRRYNQPDGSVMDLIIWLSVGAGVYVTGVWLYLRFF